MNDVRRRDGAMFFCCAVLCSVVAHSSAHQNPTQQNPAQQNPAQQSLAQPNATQQISPQQSASQQSSGTAGQAKGYTIKVGVNSVLVPVVVRDGHGRVVGDLTQKDFELFDQGKARAISGFTVQKRGMSRGLEYSGSATTFHAYEKLMAEQAAVTAIYVDGTPVEVGPVIRHMGGGKSGEIVGVGHGPELPLSHRCGASRSASNAVDLDRSRSTHYWPGPRETPSSRTA